jgi:hypothetical protein
MRRSIANSLMAGGLALLLTGIIITAFSPLDLFIFTRRISGPTGPWGILISLVGFVLAAAGGYYKLRK